MYVTDHASDISIPKHLEEAYHGDAGTFVGAACDFQPVFFVEDQHEPFVDVHNADMFADGQRVFQRDAYAFQCFRRKSLSRTDRYCHVRLQMS